MDCYIKEAVEAGLYNINKENMKNSEKNLTVLENFILYITHCSDAKEDDFTKPMTWTPEDLYRLAEQYIEEDWVDGKQNPED